MTRLHNPAEPREQAQDRRAFRRAARQERRAERAQRLRWRIARRLLRWAGMLLARSHNDVLAAQTSSHATFQQDATWGQDVVLFITNARATVLISTTRPTAAEEAIARHHLRRHDAHGLLLQLAAASYKADRAHETHRVAHDHRRGPS